MKIDRFFRQLNWRFLLVRILVNAIALAITAAITPKIYFVDKSVWSWLLMALMLGVLNALLKPLLQFLTLPFIFVTYGLVIVVVNALILLLLSFVFPARFAVDNLLWALVGGLVLGLLSSFLESLLGLTMPIVPDESPELRHQLEEQARQVKWRAAALGAADTQEQVSLDAKGAGHTIAEPAVEEPTLAEPSVAKASTPGPDEGTSSQSEGGAEAFDSGVSVDPEPAPETGEELEEDGS
jgi:putative membrane protein